MISMSAAELGRPRSTEETSLSSQENSSTPSDEAVHPLHA